MKPLPWALCALLLAGGAFAAPQSPPDRSSPEKTVRSFLQALSRADVRAALACVAGAKAGAHSARLQRELRANPATLTPANVLVTSGGDAATAALTITVAGPRRSGVRLTMEDRVRLRREGALWKIVADDPRSPKSDRSGLASVFATLLAYKGATR